MATIDFVVSGNRIATESFAIGKIYEIIFTNGNFLICACNHVGNNFVVFQRELPELLFTLNMETASSVRSIEETGGGGGTYNYNALDNKPQINSVELSGNKSSSDLGLQSALDASQLDAVNSGITAAKVTSFEAKQDAITSSNKLSADLVDDAATANKFVTAADKTTWNAKQNALTASQLNAVNSGITAAKVTAFEGKQDAITSSNKLSADLVNDAATANKFVTAADKTAWNAKQNAIDSLHMLDADLVDDTTATHKFATAAQLSQIETNKNNISSNETKINHLEQILSGLTVSRLIDFENDSTDILVGDLSRLKVYSKIGRCNLNDAGEVTAWLGDSNYSETGSNGQVMVWIPKFYYRVEPLSLEPIGNGGLGGYHLKKAIYSVSDFPVAGYKLHPAFVNEAGHEIEGFFIGAFEACTFDVSENVYNITDNQLVAYTAGTGDLLASIGCTVAGDLTSGAKPTSGLSQTAATRPNFEIIANNRGTGWHSCLIKQISAVQMLMLIEGGMITKSSNVAKINSQLNFGRGVVDITDNTSYNCSSLTGSTAGNITGNAAQTYNEINGVKTAYTVDGKVSTNWRGIENLYGNIWSFVWGMNIWGDGTMRGGQPYICKDFNYAESKNSDNYEGVGFTAIPSAGYVKYFGFGKEEYDWLFVGSATGAPNDGSGMIGDYHWVTDSLNGYRLALLGGSWSNGSLAGLFCWSLTHGVGNRTRGIGARLMFIPQN